ncbi:MAG: hypothetical protein MUD12_11600 [Spirochaetes bacterium]|jgi:triacylglycerol lipase|nr:hypothetical protein [Spirochaetota bacterium]
MIKKTLFILLFAAFIVPSAVHGNINLKYPIVLVHGWVGTDRFLGCVPYFWGVEERLEASVRAGGRAGSVYTAKMDAFNTDEIRAAQLRNFVRRVMAESGAPKVNIIAQSMGGSTARYMVFHYSDMRGAVASITTLSTPHRGTSAAHLILKINGATGGLFAWIMDNVWGKFLCGDAESRFAVSTESLTPEKMADFNRRVTDVPGIRYFSYSNRYHGISPAPLNNILLPFWIWMKNREGDNDGVVPVSSMPWGEFKGAEQGRFGIDHMMMVNQLFGITPGFGVLDFYAGIAAMLASNSL